MNQVLQHRMDEALKDVILTECQERELPRIIDWHENTKDATWTLSGPGGCGKSFLVNIIKKILSHRTCCISCPTHKALRVAEGFTGVRGITIHSLLGFAPDYDIEEFDIHNPKFDAKNPPMLPQFKLIILDEASMLQASLFDYLIDLAIQYGVRILFVGDKYQLPPVSKGEPEAISKVFVNGCVSGISELRTPVRQSMDDPHYLLLTALRSDIGRTEEDYEILRMVAAHQNNAKLISIVDDKKNKNGYFGALMRGQRDNKLENGNGYSIFRDKFDFVDEVTYRFGKEEFFEDPNYCRFLAYQNETVNSWNEHIRSEIIASPEHLVPGDLIMGYNTVRNSVREPIMINSDEYIITDVFEDRNVVTIRLNGKLTDLEIEYTYTTIKNVYTGATAKVNVLKPPYDNFMTAHKVFHDEGVSQNRWAQYYSFKNQYLVRGIIPIEDKKIKIPKQDFNYGYGITVHKSQGSTFQYVFVNMNDILKHSEIGIWRLRKLDNYNHHTAQMVNDVTLKLAYVAISRAKRHAAIYYDA